MPYADPQRQAEYQREWYTRRRNDWLADKACVKCGSTDALEVDHVDPAKKLSHRIWSWSAERRDAELAKCQVLCGTHHLEKTLQARRDAMVHGTESRYSTKDDPCRCDLCRDAHRVYKNAWREHRRAQGLRAS